MVLGALGYKIIYSTIIVAVIIILLLIMQMVIRWCKFLKYLALSKELTLLSFSKGIFKTGFPYMAFTTITGQTVNFLIDSGSVASVISDSSLNKLITDKTNSFKASAKFTGLTSNDTKDSSISYKIDLYYDGKLYQGMFYKFNCEGLFNKIENETGVKIDGIIGCDFMKKYKYIIDFKNYKIKIG